MFQNVSGLALKDMKNMRDALIKACKYENCCHRLFNVPNELKEKYMGDEEFTFRWDEERVTVNNYDAGNFITKVRKHWNVAHDEAEPLYFERKNLTNQVKGKMDITKPKYNL